jgi:hypothetical protein
LGHHELARSVQLLVWEIFDLKRFHAFHGIYCGISYR